MLGFTGKRLFNTKGTKSHKGRTFLPWCSLCPSCFAALRTGILLAVIFSLTACSGLFPTPAPTATAAPTATVTSTIVWFPATNTPTPFSTFVILPTMEELPGLGNLLFSDTFDNGALWSTGLPEGASAVVERNRITLTSRPKFAILSLRAEPILNDFYAEINIRLNLCRGSDVYGLLVRAMGNADFYRFLLNCNGQVRAERVRNGEVIPLQDWLPSGDAPLGAPGEVKVSVWAAGAEMRLFLNDRYQFTVRDPVFRSGSIGVYTMANNTTDSTVSFSDLNVYAVTYVSPTPSSTPTRTPAPTRVP
jgi:hypothetical protein